MAKKEKNYKAPLHDVHVTLEIDEHGCKTRVKCNKLSDLTFTYTALCATEGLSECVADANPAIKALGKHEKMFLFWEMLSRYARQHTRCEAEFLDDGTIAACKDAAATILSCTITTIGDAADKALKEIYDDD